MPEYTRYKRESQSGFIKRMKDKGFSLLEAARRASKKESYSSFGNKNIGASILKTKTGAEVQAGVGKAHLGVGFDTKKRSAGFDVSVGKKRFNKNSKY